MKLVRTGATRWVLLIGKYAIKFPALYSYRSFLQGILGNEQECRWYRAFWQTEKLCPILIWCPGYFFTVMPRVDVMTDEQAKLLWGGWMSRHKIYSVPIPVDEFAREIPDGPTPIDLFLRIDPSNDSVFPAEKKSDSFGYLNGKLVIIDYGS